MNQIRIDQIPAAAVLTDGSGMITAVNKRLTRLIGSAIQLLWSPAEHIWMIKMDQSQMDQILINLCVNARNAVDKSGDIYIKVQNISRADQGEFVRLTVSDNGSGMDAAILERVFDPFFTTKEAGEGTGLGLPMVYGIVTQYNGTVDIISAPGEGTAVHIDFPRCSSTISSGDEPEFTDQPDLSPKTILLAEDDPPVLSLIQNVLAEAGHRIIAAPNPKDALHCAESEDSIDLMISDVLMPGMNGPELAKRFSLLHPRTPVLLISGYSVHGAAQAGLQKDNRIHFLAKPFKAQLLQAVWKIFDTA